VTLFQGSFYLHFNHSSLGNFLVDNVMNDSFYFRFARVDDPESCKVGAAVLKKQF
jgi:hypothetical protein